MAADVLMYTTPFCPYCMRAKSLLEAKNVAFTDIDVAANPSLRLEMMERSGRRTVPQIWIGEQHIGGFDDMYLLEREGRLDDLLNGAPGAP